MDKNTKSHETHGSHEAHGAKAGETFKDSLGQENPAMDLEKKNIAEVKDRKEAEEKEAKKAEKSDK
jgi:hypothetical protein